VLNSTQIFQLCIYIFYSFLHLFTRFVQNYIRSCDNQIHTSVARNSQRISLMIKASRCIIAGCNSCVRTCAYVSSSSKIPILRVLFTMLEAGRHVLSSSNTRLRIAAWFLASSHAWKQTVVPRSAHARCRWRKMRPTRREFRLRRDRYLRRTPRESIYNTGKSGELLSYKRRSTDKIRISSLSFIVEFYCAYYATGNKRVRANK